MLALPPVVVIVLRHSIPVGIDQRFIMHVYPGIFASAGLIRLGVTSSRALSRWSQSIRDTEFLVEMRLRNYEQEKEQEKFEEKGKEEPVLIV
jgi:E3 ubiquitin-protein ligase MARCH6